MSELPTPLCGYSCDGINVWGDKQSIDAVCEAFHSHGRIEDLRRNVRHWRDECGKLHASAARLRSVNAELVKALTKVTDWLVRLAEQHERDSANNKRFPSLAEACATDARNFREIAADLSSVIARAGETA